MSTGVRVVGDRCEETKARSRRRGGSSLERHRVRDLFEAGEVAGLAAAHVVRGAVLLEHVGRLGPELEEADDEQDLQARRLRGRVPHRRGREAVEGRVVWLGLGLGLGVGVGVGLELGLGLGQGLT